MYFTQTPPQGACLSRKLIPTNGELIVGMWKLLHGLKFRVSPKLIFKMATSQGISKVTDNFLILNEDQNGACLNSPLKSMVVLCVYLRLSVTPLDEYKTYIENEGYIYGRERGWNATGTSAKTVSKYVNNQVLGGISWNKKHRLPI